MYNIIKLQTYFVTVVVFFLFISTFFHPKVKKRLGLRGVHRLGQLDSRRCLRSSRSQIVCNFIFVCKYVFLVRCVGARRKTGTQTALTSNYTAACLGDRLGWAQVCWWGLCSRAGGCEVMSRATSAVKSPHAPHCFGGEFVLLIELIWRVVLLSSHLVSVSDQHNCSLEAF